ncbi:MAG: hypothetical protein WCI96_08855 [Planctomycetota bacterium]
MPQLLPNFAAALVYTGLVCTGLVCAAPLHAGDDASVSSRSQVATTPAAVKTTAQPATDLGGYRLPLLREGTTLARVLGDLAQDPDEKLWLFRPIDPETGGLRREFVLLPSPVLEDLVRTVRAAGAPVQFEMTGRIFIYRGRNFLLADFAPTIMRFDTKLGEAPKPTDAAKTTPSGDDKFVAPPTSATTDDAVVTEIERRLEERVGRTPQPHAVDNSATRDASAPNKSIAPITNGSRLSQRLGRIARDPQSGGWRFVPQQTTGSGDASIEVMPCMLLERLEAAARESDASPAILISGTVYAYEGRSYLLPSSFRRAREGRGLGN